MRIYLPITLKLLAAGFAEAAFGGPGATAFAVTAPLRAEYAGADEEDLEYLAMLDAARASLRLIAAQDRSSESTTGPEGAFRVVLAADVDGAEPRSDLDRAAVRLRYPVAWKQVASVHIDGADAAAAVAAAAAVIYAADLADDDAEFVVSCAQDFDLAWYAPSEVSYLLTELGLTDP